MLFGRLIAVAFAEAKALGLRKALRHFFGSLRALRDPAGANVLRDVMAAADARRWLGHHEQFFHIRHRFYLSKGLSPAQRLAAVVHHYAFETSQFLPNYRQQVYGGLGLPLWEHNVGGHEFRIQLAASVQMRWEGDLSIELFVDGVRLHIMSFAYVDAAIFGLEPAPIIYITRNQTHRVQPGQGIFRATFKHTVPPYFCLAAVVGIATANDMRRVAAIGHAAQIASTPEIADTLKNSYDEIWLAFHATELNDQAFLLPVPMATAPVSELKAKHRKRALDRRRAWSAVTNAAHAAITAQLVEPVRPDLPPHAHPRDPAALASGDVTVIRQRRAVPAPLEQMV